MTDILISYSISTFVILAEARIHLSDCSETSSSFLPDFKWIPDSDSVASGMTA